MKKNYKKTMLIVLAVLVVDQVIKVLSELGFGFDWGWFAFVSVQNTGALFGLARDSNPLLIFLSFIALGFLLYYRKQFKSEPRPYALIIAGITGNLIDRIRLGYVVDMFDFQIWPVFNIADSALVIGVVWLFFLAYQSKSL